MHGPWEVLLVFPLYQSPPSPKNREEEACSFLGVLFVCFGGWMTHEPILSPEFLSCVAVVLWKDREGNMGVIDILV